MDVQLSGIFLSRHISPLEDWLVSTTAQDGTNVIRLIRVNSLFCVFYRRMKDCKLVAGSTFRNIMQRIKRHSNSRPRIGWYHHPRPCSAGSTTWRTIFWNLVRSYGVGAAAAALIDHRWTRWSSTESRVQSPKYSHCTLGPHRGRKFESFGSIGWTRTLES